MTVPRSEGLDLTSDRPPLSLAVKLNYGIGSLAQGVALVTLSAGTIQYYLNQVVGLTAALAGTLILASLVIDAVFDPFIGRLSDNFRSPWGRRHPFMYASAPLSALAVFALWNPPAGLGGMRLFAYMLVMLVVLRLCVSLYEIPSTALAPELAPDYHERTDLLAYRWFFLIAGAAVMTVVLLQVFLRQDATHPLGMLNRRGYAQFGAFAGGVMFVVILASSLSTHRYIPYLSRGPASRPSLSQAAREISLTLTNRSLLVVILAGLLWGVVGGMNDSLGYYYNLHMWGLTPQTISLIVLFATPASLVGIVLAPILSRRLDKKRTMITVVAMSIFTGVIPLSLRLMGLMPPNSSPWVVRILVIDLFFAGTLFLIGLIIASSMVADIVEDSAAKTGVRSEGLLFATNGLLPKFTSGIGSFVAGLMLTAVAFPLAAKPGTVDPQILRHLAFLSLPLGAGLSTVATVILGFYRIDRGAHEANLRQIRQQEVDRTQ